MQLRSPVAHSAQSGQRRLGPGTTACMGTPATTSRCPSLVGRGSPQRGEWLGVSRAPGPRLRCCPHQSREGALESHVGIKGSRFTRGVAPPPTSSLDGVAPVLLNPRMGPGPRLAAGHSGRRRGLLVDPGNADCQAPSGDRCPAFLEMGPPYLSPSLAR